MILSPMRLVLTATTLSQARSFFFCREAAARRGRAASSTVSERVSAEEIELAQAANVVEVGESYGVHFEARGDKFWARCPLHGERTPSFTVSGDCGCYYCFGCGAKGNSISLARALDPSLTFQGAVRLLARTMNRTTEEARASRRSFVRPVYDVERIRACRGACADARAFFSEALAARHEGGGARRYLASRGIRPETAVTFGVGWAPSQRSALCSYLMDLGHTIETLQLAGLAKEASNFADRAAATAVSSEDRFYGRVMLPIADAKGVTVGFGSRSLPHVTTTKHSSSDQPPKYVNSPATPIFTKRDVLFGIDVAAVHIAEADEAILVEGYFDVLALHDVGIKNVVAVLGVGVNEAQIERAARHCASRRVVLALDGDAAGAGAIARLCESVLQEISDRAGVDVVVASMPSGDGTLKDAADFITHHRAQGSDAEAARRYRELMDAATPWTHHRALADPFVPNAGPHSQADPPRRRI